MNWLIRKFGQVVMEKGSGSTNSNNEFPRLTSEYGGGNRIKVDSREKNQFSQAIFQIWHAACSIYLVLGGTAGRRGIRRGGLHFFWSVSASPRA